MEAGGRREGLYVDTRRLRLSLLEDLAMEKDDIFPAAGVYDEGGCRQGPGLAGSASRARPSGGGG